MHAFIRTNTGVQNAKTLTASRCQGINHFDPLSCRFRHILLPLPVAFQHPLCPVESSLLCFPAS